MGRYLEGCTVDARPDRRYQAGAQDAVGGIVSPGTVKAEVDKADSFIGTLVRDVGARNFTWADKDAFDAFFREFVAWKSGLNFLSYAWASTYEKAQEFIRRAQAFRELFKRAGGVPTGPNEPTPPPPDTGNPWKWAAIGGGIAGVVAIVSLSSRK